MHNRGNGNIVSVYTLSVSHQDANLCVRAGSLYRAAERITIRFYSKFLEEERVIKMCLKLRNVKSCTVTHPSLINAAYLRVVGVRLSVGVCNFQIGSK